MCFSRVALLLQVSDELARRMGGRGKVRVVDLCCGVGTSTRELRRAFPQADVTGVDASGEMLAMAQFLTNHLAFIRPLFGFSTVSTTVTTKWKERGAQIQRAFRRFVPTPAKFAQANAEDTSIATKSVDLVTIMYAFHEAPKVGRDRMLQEARRILRPNGTLAIVDIATDFEPSWSMLAGEPYILEYQQSIDRQLIESKGFVSVEYQALVPGHVGLWLLRRAPTVLDHANSLEARLLGY